MKHSLVILIAFSLMPLFSYSQEIKPVKLTKHLKDSLKNEIETMCIDDQKYRWMIEFGELDEQKTETYKKMDDVAQVKRIRDVLHHKTGIDKKQMDSLWKLQGAIDSANYLKLSSIIKTFGFPHKYIAEYKVTTILSHSPEMLADNSLFTILKGEIEKGNLEPLSFAQLYDYTQLGLHRQELYYVTKRYDSTSLNSVLPIPKDLELTNKARQEIGLEKYTKAD